MSSQGFVYNKNMSTKGATVEVFLEAFKAMPKKEQDIFLAEMLKDKRMREDLIDLSIAEDRAKGKSRSFKEFIAAEVHYG